MPQGSILQSLGKFPFQRFKLKELKDLCFDCSYARTTFLNCRSNRVQILETEAQTLGSIADVFANTTPLVPLSQPRRFLLQAGADAFADTHSFGLGAWLQSPAVTSWLSITAGKDDVAKWLNTDSLQSLMLSFEMLAEFLVLIQEQYFRGHDVKIATQLGNQAAEAIIYKGFTQLPVPAAITKAVQTLSFHCGTTLGPFRASSSDN